jgi:hypothetical protein
VATWFAARGLPADVIDVDGLVERLLYESGLR